MPLVPPTTHLERDLRSVQSRLGHLGRYNPGSPEREQLRRHFRALKLIHTVDKALADTELTETERDQLQHLLDHAAITEETSTAA